jgi:hypothetical protein
MLLEDTPIKFVMGYIRKMYTVRGAEWEGCFTGEFERKVRL